MFRAGRLSQSGFLFHSIRIIIAQRLFTAIMTTTTRSVSEATPLWEQAKENAAPLERGRNVAVLERAIDNSSNNKHSTSTADQRRQHERMIRHYEQLVATDNNNNNNQDDPLIHWMSYIKYQQDMGKVCDTHSHFLLLERCFRALCRNPRYTNDPRFVRIGCMYADQTARPSDIFNYMYQQKIGRHVALFWAAWAFVAEKEQDFAFTEKIFAKGIRNKAHPMQYLLTRQKQFQRRMSRHWLNNNNINNNGSVPGMVDDDDDDDQNENRHRRGVLGGLSEDAIRRNDRSRTTRSGFRSAGAATANPQTFAVRGMPQAQPLFNSNSSNTAAASAGFDIFTEETADGNDDTILDRSFDPHHDRVLERQQDRFKENTLAPERWNQRGALSNTSTSYAAATTTSTAPSRLSRSSSSSSSTALAPFAIHVDDECAAQHEREEIQQRQLEEHHRQMRDERKMKVSVAATTLLQPRGGDAMADKLAQDPLLYIRNPQQLEADQLLLHQQQQQRLQEELEEAAATHMQFPARRTLGVLQDKKLMSSSSQSSALSEVGVAAPTKNSRGFNKNLLKGPGGVEQCFEEARIQAGCFKLIQDDSNNINLFMTVNNGSMDDSYMSMDTSMDTSKAAAPTPQNCSNISYHSRRVAAAAAPTPQNCSTTSSDYGAVTTQQDPTINTQLALKELSMMFSSPAFALSDQHNINNNRSHYRIGGLGPIGNLNDTSGILSETLEENQSRFLPQPGSQDSDDSDEDSDDDDATATIHGIADLMADIERSISSSP